ncbi:potassium-transporting ATPase subunit F [Nostoc sp. CENA67]|uniref:Potassium-transporting ATPase subunit F n=1 Tax=Amazonocrinis nigriterrae CENA67 TaxID=2794033 RepID=A0A8J7L7E1_9NOST|nr:potassium-transporting ATPase subunit F [Amazonocrinis nigriterrae]MBH8563314.1 potassium-transporting ATPase subunit F [Amazonocrinis nigriterrae CENA67]
MKPPRVNILPILLPQVFAQILTGVNEIWLQWRKQKLPLYMFLAMCFNLVVAPVVYAATGEQFSHFQAWALGLLGLVTLSLSTYLFFVMFVPEKF